MTQLETQRKGILIDDLLQRFGSQCDQRSHCASANDSNFSSASQTVPTLNVTSHLAEKVHDTGEDDQKDTTTWTQPEHLGQKAFVESTKTLFLHDCTKSRPRPVVLGDGSHNLGRILDARLDNVHGSVENSTDGATDGTRDEIVGDLTLLGRSRRQQGSDLEDAAEVPSVP